MSLYSEFWEHFDVLVPDFASFSLPNMVMLFCIFTLLYIFRVLYNQDLTDSYTLLEKHISIINTTFQRGKFTHRRASLGLLHLYDPSEVGGVNSHKSIRRLAPFKIKLHSSYAS
ncbi:hypothetical protein KIL84_018067 [Mauremys mutica]|uniref:Uncharacterized protein n=1 Tax=Mauremys mutica TaxID=74926 RepID=A0A9D3XTY9_9SAUR|nr:hypothetical protein KIL84_018067 [Mauremys mutica]